VRNRIKKKKWGRNTSEMGMMCDDPKKKKKELKKRTESQKKSKFLH
jgi:hypothetical protein